MDYLFAPGQSDALKAASVGFGIFMGILPIWGFQLVVAIFLAVVLKLNKGLVIVAANISITPMIPLIIFLSFKVGALWVHGNAVTLSLANRITLATVRENFRQYLFGGLTLALAAGLAFAAVTLLVLKLAKIKENIFV
jgi:uncharacterized protein (DUF2062 family)